MDVQRVVRCVSKECTPRSLVPRTRRLRGKLGTDFGPERPQKKKNPAAVLTLTRREYEDEDRRKNHTAIAVGRSMSMSMSMSIEY